MRIKGPIGSKWRSLKGRHIWKVEDSTTLRLMDVGLFGDIWQKNHLSYMDESFNTDNFYRVDFNFYYNLTKNGNKDD